MPDMSQLLSGFTVSRETPYAEIFVPPGRPVSFLARVTPGSLNGSLTHLLSAAPAVALAWTVAVSDDGSFRLYGQRGGPMRCNRVSADGPFEVRITYAPTTGELRLLQGEFVHELTCARTTDSGFSLFVGTPPWYKGPRADGWRFDLSWSLGGEPAPPIVTPEEHPALARIRRAVLEIENAQTAIEKAVADLKGGR